MAIEPCMPIEELTRSSSGLDEDDFRHEDLDQLSTSTLEFDRLELSDRSSVLLTRSNVRAWVVAYDGRVSGVCTDPHYGGPLHELPSIVRPILRALSDAGFVLELSTPGDFLSLTDDEPVRFNSFVRGDYSVSLSLDLDDAGRTFRIKLCATSVRDCRSAASIRYSEAHEHLNKNLVRHLPHLAVPSP
jgi:hypothetical protein